MTTKMAIVALNLVSAMSAFVAAGLWFASPWVTKKYVAKVDAHGWTAAAVIEVDKKGRHTDPFETARAQGKWNRWAAAAAGVAALCQGLATALS